MSYKISSLFWRQNIYIYRYNSFQKIIYIKIQKKWEPKLFYHPYIYNIYKYDDYKIYYVKFLYTHFKDIE